MKTGYSNLLGEYLEAERIDYSDCKSFQVVCPVCREPVFKVARKPDAEALHYLAHYAAQKSFATDCELRVGGLAKGDMERHNHASRGQRLAYFLRVLRQLLVDVYESEGIDVLRRHKMMNRSPALTAWRLETFVELLSHRDEYLALFDSIAAVYIDRFNPEHIKTDFSIQVQVRIAKDMMASLLSSTGRENFFFLWNHAYIHQMGVIAAKCQRGLPLDHSMDGHLYALCWRLQRCGMSAGQKILRLMARVEMSPEEGLPEACSMLDALRGEISTVMIGTLTLLPYLKVLTEAKL
ncbi:hypothetical protein [Accumulibacter sp.]|uniref:hypothetical protein n=1 Tax=Accumulibacter sp. TaxID=2053492 RepID=UPI00261E2774|nr:hypothetical protein [Accumulibacter sp.]